VAGRTLDLTPTLAATVGATLRPHGGPGHPWPELLPRSRWGRGPAEPLAYTQVRSEVVVELVVDPAVDGPRWRHPATLVRLRPDLHPHRPRPHCRQPRVGGGLADRSRRRHDCRWRPCAGVLTGRYRSTSCPAYRLVSWGGSVRLAS
jgi:hypothetical protein